MTGLIILRCPSRPISLPSSEPQETDFHGRGFHVHRLPVGFTQQEVLAGDEIVEEKEFREYDAPPPSPCTVWAAAAFLYLHLQLPSGSPLQVQLLPGPGGTSPSPSPFWPWGAMASHYCQTLGASHTFWFP